MLSVERAKCMAMEKYMQLIGPAEIARHPRQIGITWTDWGGVVCVTFEQAVDGCVTSVVCLVNRLTGRVRVRIHG